LDEVLGCIGGAKLGRVFQLGHVIEVDCGEGKALPCGETLAHLVKERSPRGDVDVDFKMLADEFHS
jgi:hypothetical protein